MECAYLGSIIDYELVSTPRGVLTHASGHRILPDPGVVTPGGFPIAAKTQSKCGIKHSFVTLAYLHSSLCAGPKAHMT
jgi:hypothetical protein